MCDLCIICLHVLVRVQCILCKNKKNPHKQHANNKTNNYKTCTNIHVDMFDIVVVGVFVVVFTISVSECIFRRITKFTVLFLILWSIFLYFVLFCFLLLYKFEKSQGNNCIAFLLLLFMSAQVMCGCWYCCNCWQSLKSISLYFAFLLFCRYFARIQIFSGKEELYFFLNKIKISKIYLIIFTTDFSVVNIFIIGLLILVRGP